MDADLVLIHGFWSSPATWDRLIARLQGDKDLAGLRIHAFGYESPKLRWAGSPTRIPDYNDIAQSLPAYLAAHVRGGAAVVTHSQGGLILQRYLAWMLTEGRGRELAKIRLIVMLSCPNEGSEYLRSIRAVARFGRHPQAGQLDVLARQVGEARRVVLRQVINATTMDDRHCPIPVYVYSGRTDNVVLRETARSVFPNAEVLPGNHFSILDPDAPGNLTFPELKRRLLETFTPAETKTGMSADPRAGDDGEGVVPPSTAGDDANLKQPHTSSAAEHPNAGRQTWNTEELQFTDARALGRESEIAQLNEAWASSQTHVLWLIASSGVGKTALVNEWLRTSSDPTLERVFAWSFNNRSANEAALIGSEFLRAALEWVEDPTPDEGSGWIRGERLAGFLRKKPTLLLLDGLESLMHGDDVADPAVSALLTDLAQDNNGLCVVTAPRSVSELAPAENVQVLDLDDITSEAGRDILRVAGVKLKGVHIEDIVSAFGPNALAVQLLAAFLLAHPNVDVMNTIVPSAPDKRSERRYARWVLDAWIREGDLNAAELQLLRLLYIFDRPTEPSELAQIVDSKTIGLSDQLPAITDAAWHQLTDRLRSRKLILPSRPHSKETLDTHPLVRAYFGEFFDQQRNLYEAAHKTLADEFLHALGSPPSYKDTTVHSVLAAYEVVHHLLAAGDFGQAMDIHWKYVRCGRLHFQHRDYSLLSTDLSMWSEFFHIRWSELRPELGNFGLYRPYIFAEAAWNLFALGQPKDAVEAARMAFRESVSYKQWLEAAGIAENLSGYYLSLGQVKESAEFATEALRHSSNPERNELLGPWPEPAHHQVQARVMAARVALYKYDLEECEKLMQEAGEIQRRFYGDSAVRGYGTYTYVDMLLERKRVHAAIDRAEQTLGLPDSVDSDDRPEVTVGIERIALGRAYAHARDFDLALSYLDDGVGRLRQVGGVDVVALSFLERARVKRLMGRVAESEHDLRYAHQKANQAGLEPLLAMAELEMAELLAAQNKQSESRNELSRARERGRRTQYEYVLVWCERFASRVKERRDRGRGG